jgi:hypothetical protein
MPELLEIDRKRAEELLFDLASKLVRVPLGPRTRDVHLRALALKRVVGTWHSDPPDEAGRRAVIEELLMLHKTAAESARFPSGQTLAVGRRAYKWSPA